MNYVVSLAVLKGVELLVDVCNSAETAAGWWADLETGEPLPITQERVGDKLMLIVTEIAEAKEGYRKGLMDSHLTERSAVEVELADAVIRIAALSGRLGLDLGGAIAEKLAYNKTRADHTLAARRAAGGKKT
jgi:NTP pyrophosphatase (non-canonical NTP hydrolase)